MPENKETLVFAGGWASTQDEYTEFRAAARPNFNVIVVSPPDLVWGTSLRLAANSIDAIINNVGGSIHLGGHSLGGAFAAYYASLHPEKLKHLYLVSAKGVGNTSISETLLRILNEKRENGPKKSRIPKEWVRRPTGVIAAILHGPYAAKIDVSAHARKITIPTTILWGEADWKASLKEARIYSELIPNSRLITFPNMKHDWVKTHPELFWQHVVEDGGVAYNSDEPQIP